MRKAIDFVKLLFGPHRTRAIFLRREYDKFAKILRCFARLHRQHRLKHTRIVAVVGSLGKTSTRRALHTALDCPDRNFSYSNYGSSLAGNLLSVRPGDAYAVIEAGIAGPNRMLNHAKLLQPDIVVVTSIKSDHHRSFPTLEDTRREKVKIVSHLPPDGIAFLNGDDPHVRWMATQTKARVVTFGKNPENDVRAVNFVSEGDHTTFEVHAGECVYRLKSGLHGEHMIYPLLAAVAVLHTEKLDVHAALPRLAALTPVVSRMQLITLPDGTRILDDAVKASEESMQAALDTFARMPAAGRKVVVLGPVEEPTRNVREIYREMGARLASVADEIVTIGTEAVKSIRAGAASAGMSKESIHVTGSDIDDTIRVAKSVVKPGDLVLVKGASSLRLRRVVLALMNEPIRCRVKSCVAKVMTCDDCPLRNADRSAYDNYFIRRYIEP